MLSEKQMCLKKNEYTYEWQPPPPTSYGGRDDWCSQSEGNWSKYCSCCHHVNASWCRVLWGEETNIFNYRSEVHPVGKKDESIHAVYVLRLKRYYTAPYYILLGDDHHISNIILLISLIFLNGTAVVLFEKEFKEKVWVRSTLMNVTKATKMVNRLFWDFVKPL